MEQNVTKNTQDFIKLIDVLRDSILKNSKLITRFFVNMSINVALLILIVNSVTVGIEAYKLAYGLTEHELYVFSFLVCVVVTATVFLMLVVVNLKMVFKWIDGNNNVLRGGN